jgi:hypothetical protein
MPSVRSSVMARSCAHSERLVRGSPMFQGCHGLKVNAELLDATSRPNTRQPHSARARSADATHEQVSLPKLANIGTGHVELTDPDGLGTIRLLSSCQLGADLADRSSMCLTTVLRSRSKRLLTAPAHQASPGSRQRGSPVNLGCTSTSHLGLTGFLLT